MYLHNDLVGNSELRMPRLLEFHEETWWWEESRPQLPYLPSLCCFVHCEGPLENTPASMSKIHSHTHPRQLPPRGGTHLVYVSWGWMREEAYFGPGGRPETVWNSWAPRTWNVNLKGDAVSGDTFTQAMDSLSPGKEISWRRGGTGPSISMSPRDGFSPIRF